MSSSKGRKFPRKIAEPMKVDLSEYEADGFIRLNPEPRYYNVEGADPIMGVIVNRSGGKGGGRENAFYTIITFNSGHNGPITTEDGEVVEQPPWEEGDTIRIGARHQIEDTLPRAVGRKAMVLIKPLRKIETNTEGRHVWQFAIMARPLRPDEARKLASFTLAEFEQIQP